MLVRLLASHLFKNFIFNRICFEIIVDSHVVTGKSSGDPCTLCPVPSSEGKLCSHCTTRTLTLEQSAHLIQILVLLITVCARMCAFLWVIQSPVRWHCFVTLCSLCLHHHSQDSEQLYPTRTLCAIQTYSSHSHSTLSSKPPIATLPDNR